MEELPFGGGNFHQAWKLHRIAWIDVETTGLDPEKDLLLEAAIIITSGNLRELGRESVVIRHPQAVLDAAFDRPDRDPDGACYVRQMHTDNGLLEECQQDDAVSIEEADDMLASTLGWYSGGMDYVPMGGCSVWLDRSMIRLYLPMLYEKLHHRTVDASALKLAVTNWGGVELHRARKRPASEHRALPDTEDAIKLARAIKIQLQRGKRLKEKSARLKAQKTVSI